MRAILIVFVLIGFICRAQDGSPDLSFGTNGIVETNVYEFGTHYVTRVTESPDSRIILVGEIFNWTTNDKENYVAAYFENGQLDTDFGNNGFILNSSLFNEEYYFVDTFQNGDILVGGSISFEENYFMKFLPDGELDADFADNGVLFPFPGEIQRLQPVITSNNKILFPRTKEINGSVEYILEQYNADGTLDTAFGNNGSISYSFAPNGEFWRSNLIGYGDFYLLSIKVTLNNVTSNYLVRFFANGMMDENFGNSGYLPMPIEEEYFCSPITLPGQDVIYFNCYYYDEQQQQKVYKMTKLNADGTLDLDFGNGGYLMNRHADIVQPNGRILDMDSFMDWEGGISVDAFRYYESGHIDNSFQFTQNYPEFEMNVNFIMKNNGKLLIATTSVWYNGYEDIVLLQYNNSPLGIDEFQSTDLSISPNPSEAIFQLKFGNGNLLGTNYAISDISGKLIQTDIIDHSNYMLDLTGFESGMYFLVIGNQSYKLLKK